MTSLDVISRIRETLKCGGCIYGPFMKTSDPMFVEIAGIAGFDFVILDKEHGAASLQDQQNNIRASLVREMLPIIRVNELTENAIGACLDIGACGVQVPHITTAKEARLVVEYSKYYPKGMRGMCRFVRAADYSGMERSAYFNSANEALIIIQLEGRQALENIDDILSVEGIDVVFIGPYDLSQSLGVPGQIHDLSVVTQMQRIVCAAKKRNIVVGTFVDTLELLTLWKEAGVQYLSYSTDAGLFMDTCKTLLQKLQNI